MKPLSFKRHRFPPDIIRSAIWLYARFSLSFRDVGELLAERGVDASYETVRRWVLKFGLAIAANIRRSRPRRLAGFLANEPLCYCDRRDKELNRNAAPCDTIKATSGLCHSDRYGVPALPAYPGRR
jgi:hypothetical protein